MFNKFFNNQAKTIVSAAVILGAASLVSRFLGLFRDRILAGKFGAGNELDMYYAAFRIPDLVFSLLVLGAISAGFIPVFVDYLHKDKDESWYLANSVLNLMGLSLIVICSIAIIFTPWLIKLVAPGFSSEKLSTTIQLTRIMFLSPFFLGLSAIFGGVLQSFRCFLAYALGPILYNLGIIFGALVLVEHFGLFGLAYGVILGAFLHMLIRALVTYSYGFRWRPNFDFRFKGVRRIFKLMPPRILSLALSQVNLWAMTFFASFLAIGSITICTFAFNIWSFPLGVFGISFTLAAFPKLSEAAQKKRTAEFVRIFSTTVRQILFLTLPAAVFFVVLRMQIVQVVLGTGRFGWEDIALTAETLTYFSISLFAEALILLFLRGFFAWEDTRTPFLIGLAAMVVRLWLTWLYSRSMGVAGLALGFSLGSIFNLFLLFIALKKKMHSFAFPGLDEKKILMTGAKILLALFPSVVFMYLTLQSVSGLINITTMLDALIRGGLAGLVGILIYFLFAWLLRLEEARMFLLSLFNGIKKVFSGSYSS